MTALNDFDRRLGDWLEEGAQTVPDWLVEQALDQAHATRQVGAGIRWPWLIRPVRGMRVVVVLLLVLATLLAIAVGIGSLRRTEEPARVLIPLASSCFFEDSPEAFAIQDPVAIPDSDVRVHLPEIQARAAGAQALPGVVGLGDGIPGLSYGYEADGDDVYVSIAARGIVIAEVTRARSHGSLAGVELGATPGSFMTGLRDIAGFTVLDVRSVTFAGFPAAAADVSSGSPSSWNHIDRRTSDGDLRCVVDFTLPSRVTVVDADGVLVLFQVWAATGDRLRTWLPAAEAILQPLRLSRS